MYLRIIVTTIVLCAPVAAESALAQVAAYVVPGRPDVPVMINGFDARGAVVVGDWGLARPGHVQPYVLDPPYSRLRARPDAYFPSAGAMPRAGRFEVEPRTRRERSSRSYEREWFAGSADRPADRTPPLGFRFDLAPRPY